MKKYFLIFLFLLVIPLSFAYDYERSFDIRQLPITIIQPFQIHANINSTITLTPSKDWFSVNKTYRFIGTDTLYINVTINIPANATKGDYVEYINISTSYNVSSKLSFYLSIYEGSTATGHSDLNIITQDFYTNDILREVRLKLTFNNSIIDGITNNQGLYLFEDIEKHCWDLSIAKAGYKTESRIVCLVEPREERTFYLINESIDITKLPLDEQIEFQMKFLNLQIQYLESLRRREPEKIYINQTEYQVIPLSPESFSKLLNCDISNIERLERSWEDCESHAEYLTNQTNILRSEANNCNLKLENTASVCESEIKEIKRKNINWKWFVGLAIIIIIIFLYLFLKKYYREGRVGGV